MCFSYQSKTVKLHITSETERLKTHFRIFAVKQFQRYHTLYLGHLIISYSELVRIPAMKCFPSFSAVY